MDGEFNAAREGDPIEHSSAMAGFLVGAAIGLAAAVAVVAVVGTGGAALAVVGAVGGIMASTGTGALVGQALGSTFTHAAGEIAPTCSDNVIINGKRAARAIEDKGKCSDHGPTPQRIAQGSRTVIINGQPAARIKDKLECDGVIAAGSPDVFIGREPGNYLPIDSEVPEWMVDTANFLVIAGSLMGLGAGAGAAFLARGLCGLARFGATAVGGMVLGTGGTIAGGAVGQAIGGERGRIVGEVLGGAIGGFVGGGLGNRMTAGHPVDVASGELFTEALDFEVAGPIPLVWGRVWMSSSTHQGELGSGWHHPFDMALYRWVAGGGWAARLGDGRLAFFHDPAPGRPALNSVEKLLLQTDGRDYWLTDYQGTRMAFGPADAAGLRRLVGVADANGNAIRLSRGDQGRLLGIIDSAGREYAVETDDASRITAIDAPHPDGPDADGQPRRLRLVSFRYDEAGDMVAAADARGHEWHYRYENHLLVEEVRRGGLAFHFVWDDVARGRAARCVETWGTNGLYHAKLNYDLSAHTTEVVTGRGAKSLYRWNPLHLIDEETDPLGQVTKREFDQAGRLVSITGPDGATLRLAYDELGRLVERVTPDGAALKLGYGVPVTGDLTRPDLGRPAQVVEPDGASHRFTYDPRGNLAQHVSPSGQPTSYLRDGRGLPLALRDALGTIQRFTWSAGGDLLAEATEKGPYRQYDHDALGRVISVQRGTDAPLRLSRDENGNPITIHRPDGGKVVLDYDAEDHVTRHKDPLGRVTRWRYDGLPYPLERIAADGSRFQYHYDSELNLIGLTNAKGERYRLDYDPAGRLVAETGFDGRLIQYRRDAAGFVVESTDQGRATLFSRDVLGRLVAAQFADGRAHHYRYDVVGRLLAAETPDHANLFAYDTDGRLSVERQGSLEIRHLHDARGRRTATLLPDGRRVELAWGEDGLPSAVGCDGREIARFQRDAAGREIGRQAGSIFQRQDFDPQGRLIRQEGVRRGGAVSFSRAYGYDGADALVAIEDAKRGVRRYRYDACDRLLAVEGTNPESFVPDPAGNILASGADAGFWGGEAKGDRLLVHGDAKFQYDAWGNRVREWRAAGGAVSLTYRYDASNRLVAVERQDRRGRTLARYGYDAFGRRLWKQTAHLPPASANDDAPSPGGDASGLVWQRTDFLWDGDVLLGESAAHAPDAPSPDPLAIVYLHEPGSFRPLAQLRRNDGADQRPQVYHYHLDHLGTPQELTNDNGELVWQAEYRAWGALAKLHVAEVENPLRFQGQYHDAETGLHYNRHRYYAPNEGCFTTQDPIRLAGGSNLAAYAPNPVEWVDPLGLSCGVDGGSSKRVDYSRGFEDDLVNFNPGYSLKSGKLTEDLTLVSYHQDTPFGEGRSAKWWTTTDQANSFSTVDDVHQGLALPPEWGKREVTSVAKIPKGTDITAYIGTAKEQQSNISGVFKGGATQLRFKDFDPSWIVESRRIP
ncbi:RHS repeat-associated core domain-containing protein [Niveispirillum sp. BGYR6]|uniref:RHS repeat-associated core domain-containing protein n=1 Tax=Niveispirillum sp. BGYR6 TaxID=2971249 RepID=UPI0022B981E4|nr:RHS repeat-associated core domain-containing protein [Niveispirillum sp. BGYR6]MDG5493415.1 RHS repeat-associated core domain-containing protein [Niveispirillum sp. BGYR6]